MKKKTVKTAAVAEKETQLKESDTKEVSVGKISGKFKTLKFFVMSVQAKARVLDGKSEETVASDDVPNSAVIPLKPSNTKSSRGLNQQFLDLFWKLADNEAGNRLAASLEIIKHVDSAHSSVSFSQQ